MDELSVLSRFRKTLHQMPELSELEFKTSDFIAATLKECGHKFKRIGTGVVCDISGVTHSKKIGLRADIDALPITEKSANLNPSTNGCMHACGHDGHMAMLLALAQILSENKPKCDIRLIFQFGEEGCGGAEKMIEKGASENLDEIYAFHMCPELELGSVSSCAGAMFAGTVEFDVEFSGKASHCASKAMGVDVVPAVNYFITNSTEFNKPYQTNTLFHIGKITCGSARNIVAANALMECTLRFFDEAQQEHIMMKIAASLTESDNLFATSHKVLVKVVYPPLINSGIALGNLKKVFPNLQDCKPRYTAEDFAFFAKKTTACMSWLGCMDEKHFSPLHSDTFDFDDKAMLTGLEIYKKIVF